MGKRCRTVEALRFATKTKHAPTPFTPLALRKSVSWKKNTYLAWEVSDGERTIYVVREKVVIEKL